MDFMFGEPAPDQVDEPVLYDHPPAPPTIEVDYGELFHGGFIPLCCRNSAVEIVRMSNDWHPTCRPCRNCGARHVIIR